MTMSPLLIEIGTEELPPKALRGLMTAFADGVAAGLAARNLQHGTVTPYASPRRLSVVIDDVPVRQEDIEQDLKGPPVSVAFDDAGAPTPAAEAFAKKCGVAVAELERRATDKGEWLYCRTVQNGLPLAELIGEIIGEALGRLPVPRPMRWGDSDAEFVRPVHWVLLLHGEQPLPATVLGVQSGTTTRGHRFHAPEALGIDAASEYAERLERDGFVLADYEQRLAKIRTEVAEAAGRAGGVPVASEGLYDEVASLVEWPQPVVGRFDDAFLALPPEVVIATLTNHQRYFPVADKHGRLLPQFVTVANIVSREPDRVRDGNERVIRPRLADAAFFWESDQQTSPEERLAKLEAVVYQKGLGSIADKSRRVAALAESLASVLGGDVEVAARAGLLCKADLTTGMVGEFPELQGVMGGYYARAADEPAEVAAAIGEHYRPAYSGDGLPESLSGRLVALADRLDTLAGAFVVGKRPSGNKDPFGLRRAALGVVRLAVEGELEFALDEFAAGAVEAQPVAADAEVASEMVSFIHERLRGYAQESLGASTEMFEAVLDRAPPSLFDFAARLRALKSFAALDEAAALAAANKRIANILRKSADEGAPADTEIEAERFVEAAEKALFAAVEAADAELRPLLKDKAYTAALERLASLREPVDRFFDDVMVMVDDQTLRNNRLALLAALRRQFLEIADVSRLAIR